MSLKIVKNKIKSVDKTRQVTKAMEAVSAVKMRKSQENALRARPYALHALKILQAASGSTQGVPHPLMRKRERRNSAVVLVTSDRGLAGSLNSSLLKAFGKLLEDENIAKETLQVIAVGRRGSEYCEKHGILVRTRHEHWGDFVSFDMVAPLLGDVQGAFEEEEIDEAWIVYTNFISTLEQTVYTRKLLPLSFEAVEEAVAGILPHTGRFTDLKKEEVAQLLEDKKNLYNFEPDEAAVLKELIPMLLKVQLYHSVLEANASEHSARMVAMKNASENAGDLLEELGLSYNKARQAAITKEINEIVGGTLS